MNTRPIIWSIAGLVIGAAVTYFAIGNNTNCKNLDDLLNSDSLRFVQSGPTQYYSEDAQTSDREQNDYFAISATEMFIIINEDTIASNAKTYAPGEAKIYTLIDLKPGEYIEKQDTSNRVIIEKGIAGETKAYSESDILKTYTPASDYRILSPNRTKFCVQPKSVTTDVMDCYSTTIQRLCILYADGKLIVIKRPFKDCIE